MRTPTPRCLAIALAALCFALGSTGADAAGIVNIATCQTLTTPNTVYRLTEDLTACDECLIVTADRITIDLQGRSIIGTCDGSGVGIAGQDVALTTVRNGLISGFGVGIDLLFSRRSQVLNVHAVDNLLAGIFVGTQSLVKSSSASGSLLFGILADERSQIQDSDASFNFLVGIAAGDRCLVTRNTANGNEGGGIATGGSCTVSFNVASGNGGIGILAGGISLLDGSNDLVTRNIANDNGDIGISVQCPGTVTFNQASGNGLDYELFGTPPCRTVNNN